MKEKNIKYQIWKDGILDSLDREVFFEFCIPVIFNSFKSAQKAVSNYIVMPKKLESGEVVFEIYEKDESSYGLNPDDKVNKLIDTIHFNEPWKYNCSIVKECGAARTAAEVFPKINLGEFGNLPCFEESDLDPCTDKFEDIYDKYLKRSSFEDVAKYSVQNTAYLIASIKCSEYNNKAVSLNVSLDDCFIDKQSLDKLKPLEDVG